MRDWPLGTAGPTPLGWRWPQPLVRDGIGGWPANRANTLGRTLPAAMSDAVFALDARAGLTNIGTAGDRLRVQSGSTATADTNDPTFLPWRNENYLYFSGVNGNNLSLSAVTATINTLSFTVRMDWQSSASTYQAIWSRGTGVNRFACWLNYANVAPRINWFDGGNTARDSDYIGSLLPSGMGWRRFTIDASGANTVLTVETAPDQATEPSTWTSHGTKTVVGVTGITVSGNTGYVATSPDGSHTTGSVYAFIERHDGTVVTQFDPSNVTAGSNTSVTLTTGGTGTINRSTSGKKACAVVRPVWLFGTDDHLEVLEPSGRGLLDFGQGQNFTVIAINRGWANMGNDPLVAKKVNFVTNDLGWTLGRSATATRAVLGSSTSWASGNVDAAGSYGALTFSGLVVTNTTMTVYNNTTATNATTSPSGSFNNTYSVRIGASSVGNVWFNGEIFAAAIWRRALSTRELTSIAKHYGAV